MNVKHEVKLQTGATKMLRKITELRQLLGLGPACQLGGADYGGLDMFNVKMMQIES